MDVLHKQQVAMSHQLGKLTEIGDFSGTAVAFLVDEAIVCAIIHIRVFVNKISVTIYRRV